MDRHDGGLIRGAEAGLGERPAEQWRSIPHDRFEVADGGSAHVQDVLEFG